MFWILSLNFSFTEKNGNELKQFNGDSGKSSGKIAASKCKWNKIKPPKNHAGNKSG